MLASTNPLSRYQTAQRGNDQVETGRSGSATTKDAAGNQGVTDGTDPTSRG
jgi:hypothetical protein